jgi:CHAD domain-containing protein
MWKRRSKFKSQSSKELYFELWSLIFPLLCIVKALVKYLKKRKEGIQSLLHKAKQSNSMDFYHDLRVEIKKLKALFDLIDDCSKNFKPKKTIQPFQQVFDQAGRVRELQIEEQMLRKNFDKHPIGYRHTLHMLKKEEQENFYELIDKRLFAEQKKAIKNIKDFLQKIDKKDLKAYLEKKRGKIDKMLGQKNPQVATLHQLRKRLKKYDYVADILDSKKKKETLREDKNLLDLLGDWHDCRVTARHLNKAIHTRGISKKDIARLEAVRSKIFSQSRNLFKKVRAEMIY